MGPAWIASGSSWWFVTNPSETRDRIDDVFRYRKAVITKGPPEFLPGEAHRRFLDQH